jgi:hypothetical protein
MQKVYLLLRSNKQSGPYTIDELLGLNLKPLDLVWVEGKSFGWSYPSEIENLKTFVEAPVEDRGQIKTQLTQQASQEVLHSANNKKIFVSLPVNGSNTFNSPSKTTNNLIQHRDEVLSSPVERELDHQALEIKADEIRQRAQAYASSKPALNKDDEVEIKYAKSLAEVEEEYTSWVYRNKVEKKKHLPKEQLLSVLAVFAVITGGWFIGSKLFNKEVNHADQVVHVQNAIREEPTPVISEEIENDNLQYDITDNKPLDKKSEAIKLKEEKVVLPEKPVIEKYEPIDAIATIDNEKIPEAYEKPILKNTEEPVAEVEQTKKKTLGESVSNVFRKLIKNDEAETKSESTNGERKSNRRDDPVPAETDISEQVEIRMNSSSDNWMMGVIGLKLTLFNKSSIPVKTAVIEILYYNDQDKIIDKKRITFSNIAPRKSQTISAPDHRLADRAEYKIISATGINDAYAKN